MSPIDAFRRLSSLLVIIEKLGSPQRTHLLTFRDTVGKIVGRLTLDSGMVRFGVSIADQPLVDDVFMQEAEPYSPILQRLIAKAPLSREDIHRVECVPLLLRRVFRSLTARTLRRLATLCDPERIEIVVEDAAPQGALDKLLDFCFPPVELLLIAGRTGTIRYADTAARIYEIPPNLAEQRWLFEWQPDDLDCGLAQRYARSRYPGGMAARWHWRSPSVQPPGRTGGRGPYGGCAGGREGHPAVDRLGGLVGRWQGTVIVVVHLGCIGVDGADVRRGRDCGALADRACAVRLRKCVPPVV